MNLLACPYRPIGFSTAEVATKTSDRLTDGLTVLTHWANRRLGERLAMGSVDNGAAAK